MSRSFDICRRLFSGERLSLTRIEFLYGVTNRQAYRIVKDMEIHLPVLVIEDEAGRHWRLMEEAHVERR